MTDDDVPNGLNWDKIHDMVVEKGNSCVNGIKMKDIDWFLRDSNVSATVGRRDLETSLPPQSTDEKTLTTPASPQMATTVSNTNENISGKLKPTISPISEEPIISSSNGDAWHSQRLPLPLHPRRRSSAASLASAGSNGSTSSGGGFFSKLKNKFHKSDIPGSNGSPSLPPQSVAADNTNLFKKDYQMRLSRQQSPPKRSGSPAQLGIESKTALKEANDPRLDEFVRFYKQPDLRRSSTSRRNSSRSQNGIEGCLLNPLPVKKHSSTLELPKETTASKFTSLLRRRSVTSTPGSTREELERDSQSC